MCQSNNQHHFNGSLAHTFSTAPPSLGEVVLCSVCSDSKYGFFSLPTVTVSSRNYNGLVNDQKTRRRPHPHLSGKSATIYTAHMQKERHDDRASYVSLLACSGQLSFTHSGPFQWPHACLLVACARASKDRQAGYREEKEKAGRRKEYALHTIIRHKIHTPQEL